MSAWCACGDSDRRALVAFEYRWSLDPATSRPPEIGRDSDGQFRCERDGGLIACEFSEDEAPCAASRTHIDYVVCDEHFSIAVDNVSSRRWS